jgi:MoxR-like ATPase
MTTSQEIRPELRELVENIETVIKGKSEVVRLAVIGLMARGHLLFEDVPGVGKTALAQCLAQSISCTFQRIQFTSDMLPSDIIGVTFFDQSKGDFEFRPGPLFANLVLADEINRTSPKTQSSLLEAMNRARVSIEKTTYVLPQPFLVLATQNPTEFHGTFPLPNSQMDRFLMRLSLGYPDAENERTILREQKALWAAESIEPVLTAERVIAMQSAVDQVRVEDSILDYIVRISRATRESPDVELGASVRASLALRRAAQAKAYVEGRDWVAPDDVKELAVPALAHRIQMARTFETAHFNGSEDEACLLELLKEVPAPI